jgi:chemotaxis protein MotA
VRAIEAQAEASRDPLVTRALQMTAQYLPPAEVRLALDHLLDLEDERGMREVATLDAAGGYAPTFGVIGAVLGLIFVLRSIADPSAIGTGIATAFVATLYGLGVSNLILFPLASRLRERHQARMKQREILADALVALSAHESPVRIAARLAGRG